MTFAQRQNRLTTHFSERIPVVKRHISVYKYPWLFFSANRVSRERENEALS